jgi:AraC-like DNA-binding protein
MLEIVKNISRPNPQISRGNMIFGDAVYTLGAVFGQRIQYDIKNLSWTNPRMWRGNVVFGDAVYAPGGICGPRIQPDYQLVILHRGELDLRLDDKWIAVAPGQGILLNPGHREHFIFSREHETYHSWCAIDGRAIPEKLRRMFRSSCKPVMVDPRTNLLMELGKAKCFADQPAPGIEDSFYLNLGLALLTGHALSVQPDICTARPEEQALSRAKQFILKEFGRSLSLNNLAMAANVSKPQLLRLFRDFIGASPIQYLYEQRLCAAAERLVHTGLSIKEIAEGCGFANEFHFSRKFKQAYGRSPRVWRSEKWAVPRRSKSENG